VNADCYIEDIVPGKSQKVMINVGQPKGEGEEALNLPPEVNPKAFRTNTVPDIINNVSSVDGVITKDHITKQMAKGDLAPDEKNPFTNDDEQRESDLEI